MNQGKMEDRKNNRHIPSETIAAYLDGNASAEECRQILEAMAQDEEIRELMQISLAIDKESGIPADATLPMTAMAATLDSSNLCCIRCEEYILKKHGIDHAGTGDAKQNGWLKDSGTALYDIGRILESNGFTVIRQYNSSIEDIVCALQSGKDLIAVVDGGELLDRNEAEMMEDIVNGPIPDHTVVITACDPTSKRLTIHDPNSPDSLDTYPIDVFEEAWADSKHLLVIADYDEDAEYIPHPIDLSDIVLDDSLNELREAIAENAHEVWASNRKQEGWTYGPVRNDVLKQTPDMVPYSKLPESEKEYDRDMAIKTIKLLIKLGYEIVKKDRP